MCNTQALQREIQAWKKEATRLYYDGKDVEDMESGMVRLSKRALDVEGVKQFYRNFMAPGLSGENLVILRDDVLAPTETPPLAECQKILDQPVANPAPLPAQPDWARQIGVNRKEVRWYILIVGAGGGGDEPEEYFFGLYSCMNPIYVVFAPVQRVTPPPLTGHQLVIVNRPCLNAEISNIEGPLSCYPAVKKGPRVASSHLMRYLVKRGSPI